MQYGRAVSGHRKSTIMMDKDIAENTIKKIVFSRNIIIYPNMTPRMTFLDTGIFCHNLPRDFIKFGLVI